MHAVAVCHLDEEMHAAAHEEMHEAIEQHPDLLASWLVHHEAKEPKRRRVVICVQKAWGSVPEPNNEGRVGPLPDFGQGEGD